MPVRENIRLLSQLLALFVLASLTVFMAWVVLGGWFPKNTVVIGSLIVLFTAAPLGALWMLLDCARHEKHPLVYLLLAFVPYAFVWYYVERVRPRRHRSTDQIRLS